ncbi:alpha-1,2-fucosyltransferase [Photobacterium sp. NCIMB 13483]|uniref:alpha-1,2-fucosyltransferase n=1 Tax=Photobacterium sp. NCIMB 13483 TaxID=2022103 RepID=UPI000D15586D|nr:alpha-1,2-fucosyltransferase [Photobacterium sp. NCIMB 13483]PST85893.1 alpha-1,2-fucosyltransferase [Photobacterium sp. NCIMB 13483]
MLKIEIIGGLGNQLFQYATALSIAKRNNTQLVVDVSVMDNYDVHPLRLNKLKCTSKFININHYIKNTIYNKKMAMINPLVYKERKLTFDSNIFSVNKYSYLYGYFQSEKYFIDIRDVLLDEFDLMDESKEKNKDLIDMITRKNSISLHIRRGDYLSNEAANKTHGICDQTYYEKAIKVLEKKGRVDDNTIFYVFSDDIDWCKENINFGLNTKYIEGSSLEPEVDMYLMSLCENNIIANSTFSWWAAWLNRNKTKIVIAPEKWFVNENMDDSTLIPNSWIRL